MYYVAMKTIYNCQISLSYEYPNENCYITFCENNQNCTLRDRACHKRAASL